MKREKLHIILKVMCLIVLVHTSDHSGVAGELRLLYYKELRKSLLGDICITTR